MYLTLFLISNKKTEIDPTRYYLKQVFFNHPVHNDAIISVKVPHTLILTNH